MFRTKLKDRTLPDYTKREEHFNMITHIVGGGFGVTALVLCVVRAALHHNPWGVVSGAIYGVMMILLYTMSSIYHGLTHTYAKKVFQVLDHCSIFFLIFGTYTPCLLTEMRAHVPTMAWILFGIVSVGCIVGVTLNAIDLKQFRIFSMLCYLFLGWCILFAVRPILRIYPHPFFYLLLAGGVAYSVGTVFYARGVRHRYRHAVFHLFVLAGSILHLFAILLFCM